MIVPGNCKLNLWQTIIAYIAVVALAGVVIFGGLYLLGWL